MNLALDLLQLVAVLGLALAAAFGFLGLWNLLLSKLVAEAKDEQADGNFIAGLRKVALSRMSSFNRRTFPTKYQLRISNALMHGGNPGDLLPPEFIGLQLLALGGFTTFGLFLAFAVDLRWYWVPAFMLLGWFYPWIWLNDKIKKRQHMITRALPYNLDLLTLSVEAGLDFAQAVGKVVDKGRQGPLVEEFRLVLKNIKLGKTREEALRGMGERCGLAPITSFVNALIQADKMGTSLGKILRIQSTQLRIERTHRAEKLANEAPVKMLFPLIACIFPTVFMVLFGPIIFQAIVGGD
jgi:tight adherence protein C